MPATVTKLTFVPSRWGLIFHALIALSAPALLAQHISWWVAVPVGMVLCMLAWREVQRVPPSLVWDAAKECWYDSARSAVDVRVFRLGPRLIGLKCGGKRYWVWPDSCDPSSLWILKRALLRQGMA